ncbi:hypothetical protein NOJ28_18930 [Neorhizobium galegae]|uniref:hypothetical protein n=1 Tax=Neorhizobium galegae TaxID=399 RepID=UPI00062168E5|nr:hypothetical protein [Neorhizobium galegae]MCQ1767622.1 hypothetical protein [Neorhizobium galegae]MCQ1847961.1 hypothetical protein [Neorhizobium galegae]CDZ37926.1 Hypothetical protein NGAL_HAMBI1146_26170 [Neorhizobium galegae bv. officinalis]
MRYPTSNVLIAVVVLLSLLLVLLMEAPGLGAFSPLWIRPIIRVICAANLLVALAGLGTSRPTAWINYLLLSFAAYVVASATPIAALWIIPKNMFSAVTYAFSSLW